MGEFRLSREHRWLAIVVVLALLVSVGSFLLRPQAPDADATEPRRERHSLDEEPTEAATTAAEHEDETSEPTSPAQASPLTRPPTFPGLGTQPGVSRGTDFKGQPAHQLTVKISSAAPLGRVAYIIPTGTSHTSGHQQVSDNQWSVATTVFGPPAYAAVFMQSGWEGRAVTCEIRVDGQVVERRTIDGRFSATWCLG